MTKKILSIRKLNKVFSEVKFDPREDVSHKIIVDMKDSDYPIKKSIELLMTSRTHTAMNTRSLVIQVIRLLLLHLMMRNETV